MQNKIAYLALAVALLALGLSVFHPPKSNMDKQSTQHETAFERVMRTGTLRCGYVIYAPYIMKDPNTGKLSGVYYDYTERLGKMTGLKIDWNVETNYTVFAEELKNGRYDVFCGGLWPDVSTAKVVEYSIPTNYSDIGVYVRNDDHRFDDKIQNLNDPQYKFATIDGDTSQILLQYDFPKAAQFSLPNTVDISALAETVKAGKADATIMGEVVANNYQVANPGTLRNIYKHPIRVYENVYAFAPGETRLVLVINTAIKEMIYGGMIDSITAKYAKKSNDFYSATVPYTPMTEK